PPGRPGQVAAPAPPPLPHQAGDGGGATVLAAARGGGPLRAALGGGRWRLRRAALPQGGPPGGVHGGQPPAQGCSLVVAAGHDPASRSAWPVADLWQAADQPGQAGRTAGRLAAGGVCAVRPTAGENLQKVSSPLAGGRRGPPGGGGPRGGGG